MDRFAFHIILMLVSGITLTACLPDPLEVTGIPKIKPQIVVSTQIIPDETLVVLLTKSFGALDASEDSDPIEVLNQIAINDAFVTIQSRNGIDTLLFLGNGLYGGVFIPFTLGDEYTLHVNSETLGEVTASTYVKPRIDFEAIAANLFFDGFDDTLAQISYYFKDAPEKNWYMINVIDVEREDLQEEILNPRMFTRMLDDRDFFDEHYSETFQVFPREFSKGDTIGIYLSNISEEYYNFMQLRIENRFSLIEYISEPLNYPSNVKGGKGFFNLYVPDIRFFILE